MSYRSNKELFVEAVEIESDSARDEFLRQACGSDDVRFAEIQSMLVAYRNPPKFLQDLDEQPNGVDQLGGVVPGSQIGPYTLCEVIGEGGFGVVFVAQQQKPVARQVALKIVKPGMDSRELLGRFDVERQALAVMDHPNIARVFDAGSTEAGRPYFVMELIQGTPISDYCNQTKEPIRGRLELFVTVCRAVQYAHQKGIIHRDLKPQNVLVTQIDGRAVPKVIDFGVAKATNSQLSVPADQSRFARLIGTPLYMSPEQAAMSSLDVDTRSDVYSLGVMLYELLTDTTPFDQPTLHRVGADEMRRLIREVDPAPPSVRISTLSAGESCTIAQQRGIDSRRLRQFIRGELDWIVMKTLDKDPGRRYESAGALAADLERFLQGEPIQACPQSLRYRLRKFVQRNRAALLASSLVIAALCIGTVISMWQALEANRARRLANHRFLNERAARQTAEARQRVILDQRALIESRESSLREQLYAQDLKLAWLAWRNGDLRETRERLSRHVPVADQRDSRSFGWYYLASVAAPPLRMTGHQGNVYHLDYSPDGRLLASAGADRTVRLWDVVTRESKNVLSGHSDEVNCVSFSADGKLLASGSDDRTARVWIVETGGELTTLDPFERRVARVMFVPQSSSLVVGELSDNSCCTSIWDSRESARLATFDKQFPLVVYPDGSTLVTSGEDRNVHFWDVATQQELFSMEGNGGWVRTAAYDPRQGILAHDWMNGPNPVATIRLSDAANQREVGLLFGHSGGTQSLCFSRRGDLLASASDDGTSCIWSPHLRTVLAVFRDQKAIVRCARFAPDGRQLAVCGDHGAIELWQGRWGHLNVPDPVSAICFLNHTDKVAILTRNGSLWLWDRTRNERDLYGSLAEATFQTGRIRDMHFVPDRNQLVLHRMDGRALRFDLSASELGRERDLQSVKLEGLSNGPSGSFEPAPVSHVTIPEWSHTAVSVDDRWFAWTDNHQVHVVDRLVKNHVVEPFNHEASVEVLAFSRDASLVASGGVDRRVILWNLADRGKPSVLLGHDSSVTAMAFSPDGRVLVTGSRSGQVKLWSVATRQELYPLIGHSGLVQSVAFDPSGRVLITAGESRTSEGEVFVWQADAPWEKTDMSH